MIECERIEQVRKTLDAARQSGKRVGFVPTMGALHEGHMSLVARAGADNDVVAVSIFVNPAQFGPHEDLDAYPRPRQTDLALCREAEVDLVFAPSVKEMYPGGVLTRVSVSALTAPMEGEVRPGHFDGMCLVVTKLLNIVGPCRAYFGEKDAQQLRVVRRMVADLDAPCEVVACPTVREHDGLALSSRNAYLTPGERQRARFLSRALFAIRDMCAAGERRAPVLLQRGRAVLAEGSPDRVDYLECVDPDTLEAIEEVSGCALVCGAVRIGKTRLIDNVEIHIGRQNR